MLNLEFLLTSLVVVLIPGTGVIYTLSTGLALRGKASLAAAFGCTLGILPHLTASILGLSAILHLSTKAFQIIKWVGALYLLYLAWGMWQETGVLQLEPLEQRKGLLQIILKGILINILNPKLTLFFFAFLPQFIHPEGGSPTRQMLGMSAVFMGMTLVIFMMYGLFASRVREYLINSPRGLNWVQRSFAVIFAVLAVKLALSKG
jgi:threonine/homoserine/homoserine lactone efflux protein